MIDDTCASVLTLCCGQTIVKHGHSKQWLPVDNAMERCWRKADKKTLLLVRYRHRRRQGREACFTLSFLQHATAAVDDNQAKVPAIKGGGFVLLLFGAVPTLRRAEGNCLRVAFEQ